MSDTALLVIDMFNTYDHPDAEKLAESAAEVVAPIAELVERAGRRDDVDVIYVNDNYGDFAANHSDIIQGALQGARPDLVRPLVPSPDTRFLTKVRHSAFYATALDYLLGRLQTKRLILTGQVTEQCILYSALDAYVRGFEVRVARDAVVPLDPELGEAALTMMERNMRARVVPGAEAFD